MKIFFISDIHSNFYALKAILEHAKNVSSDIIACCGDISGYFVSIEEVIALLKMNDVKCILGNHDAFLLNLLPISESAIYYKTMIHTKKVISMDSYLWLKGLNTTELIILNGERIRLYHGGPMDLLNQYVYPDQIKSTISSYSDADIFAFGHSHKQFIYKAGDKYFINPGSVGLPRDGDYRASGISYDQNLNKWEIHKINYDLKGFLNELLKDNISDRRFLHNVLFGRSSFKRLKDNKKPFISRQKCWELEAKRYSLINTVFGVIIRSCDFPLSDFILYIAYYDDLSIELTTSTFVFKKLTSLDDQLIHNLQDGFELVKNKSGYHLRKTYLQKSTFNSCVIKDVDLSLVYIVNLT